LLQLFGDRAGRLLIRSKNQLLSFEWQVLPSGFLCAGRFLDLCERSVIRVILELSGSKYPKLGGPALEGVAASSETGGV